MFTEEMKRSACVLSAAALMALAGNASAAIIGTYVDATLANSDNAAGGDDSTWATTNDSRADNLWRYPATSAHGSWDVFGNRNAFEAYGSDEPSVPTIVTTLTGLTPGASYDIRLIFGSHTAGNQSIKGGLSQGSLTAYDNTSPLAVAGTLYYEDGYMNIYQPLLGAATASLSGEIKIYIAANSVGVDGGRALYDGIAYDAVPEPAALSLLALGGCTLLRRRRG